MSGRVERERGARVAVARLADRAGIHDVAQAVAASAMLEWRVTLRHEPFEGLAVRLEDDGQVGVAEQAELTLARLQRPLRVVGVEDVVVLVERRAVTDLDAVVDHDGPGRQRPEILAVVLGQRLAGPHRGVLRDLVEVAGVVDPAGRLVVIAADDRDRLERADPVDDGVGLGAVADEVAEHEQRDPTAPRRASTASSASRFAWMSDRMR